MGVLDTAKDLVEVIRKIDNIELYKKVLDLQTEVLKLFEENSKLKETVKSLEDTLAVKETLVHDQNAYWIPIDDGTRRNLRDGPFCAHCWDNDRKLVRLHHGDVSWWCLTHRQQFKIKMP
jgi:hypothetical protein